ncbi:condensation domain-containing protein [Streptomyces sp. NPDC058195]|uniref:condensation domain-containing protein n=1 Tax=Streptomyces sp. NPDC058195 TaxID=3346375 RepID=UPI0036E9BD8D
MSDSTSSVEETLLGIMRAELDDEEIGLDDDFYAMGGDSLIALRVVAEATGKGIDIQLRDILYYPTVRELAVSRADVPAAAPSAVPAGAADAFGLIDDADRARVPPGAVDALPASALQVGLIYMSEMADDTRLYHDLTGAEIEGRFDEDRFRACLTALCARHPALRTSIDLGGYTQPMQLVWGGIEPPLTVERIGGGGAKAADAKVTAWAEAELTRSIDWSAAPVWRCYVVVLPESFRLAMAVPHSIIDGWSYGRLFVDLLSLYNRELGGGHEALPLPPPSGHADFIRLEREALGSAQAAAFWRAEADVPPLLFGPEDFARVPVQDGRHFFPVGPSAMEGLRKAAKRAEVPLKCLVLGVQLWALGEVTGRSRDIVSGVTVNGRPEVPHADLLIGLFLNTMPLRLRTRDGDWDDIARRVFAAEKSMVEYRHYPVAELQRKLGRRPFDVTFNFTELHAYEELGGLSEVRMANWWAYDRNSFPVNVEFMVNSRHSGTGVQVAYDPGLITEQWAAEFSGVYRAALESAAGEGA